MVGEENMATNPERFPGSHLPSTRPATFPLSREVEKLNSPESKKNPTKKAAVARLAGVILAIAAANAGVAAKYHMDYDVPLTPAGITEDITHIPQEWVVLGIQAKDALSKIGEKEKPVLPTFESKTGNQIIQAGINAVPVTENDLASISTDIIKSSLPDKPPTLNNLIFPVMLQPEDKIDITKNLTEYTFNIPRKGTQLTAGILDKQAKTIEVFKLPLRTVRDAPYFTGIIIRITRNDGYKYGISFMSPEDIRFLAPLPILDDAPVLENELIQEGGYYKSRFKDTDQPGKIISGTTPILETGRADATVKYKLGDSRIFTGPAVFAFSDANFATDSNDKIEFIPPLQK